MTQCSKTTNVYSVLGILKGQGGRCSRRATYVTDGGSYVCTQHAKVEATALAPSRNKIRADCTPINTMTGRPYEGAPHPSATPTPTEKGEK